MSGATVVKIDQLDLVYAPQPWDFAVRHRADIDAYFAERQRRQPALWNGRVLLLYRYNIVDRLFSGACLETDYASFLAWRDGGLGDGSAMNCFSAAAVVGSDGGFLLGLMGRHTANAGAIYFPCGTPDPDDLRDGQVDLERSVRRELKEEAGFDAGEFIAEPGWTTVLHGSLIAHIKVLRSQDKAAVLQGRALAFLTRQEDPELSDIRIVRRPADLVAAVPEFMAAFLTHRWEHGGVP